MQARQHDEAAAAAAAGATAAAGAQSVLAGRVTELEEQLQAARTAADVDADAARWLEMLVDACSGPMLGFSARLHGVSCLLLYIIGNVSKV